MCGAACDWKCDCGCGETLWKHGVCEGGKPRCAPGWSGKCCEVPPPCKCPCAHGDCVEGQCKCADGWSGECCEVKLCPDNCCGLGRCVDGYCECDAVTVHGEHIQLSRKSCTEGRTSHGAICAGCAALS